MSNSINLSIKSPFEEIKLDRFSFLKTLLWKEPIFHKARVITNCQEECPTSPLLSQTRRYDRPEFKSCSNDKSQTSKDLQSFNWLSSIWNFVKNDEKLNFYYRINTQRLWVQKRTDQAIVPIIQELHFFGGLDNSTLL